MDLYTLTSTFLPGDIVDEFVSAIWTERYSSAGDVQLVVPATTDNIAKLADGTFLALRGSDEVMSIATQSIENGLMTIVGQTLTSALNQRIAWFANPSSSAADSRISDFTSETMKPGPFIANAVDKMAIHPATLGGAWAPADLSWANEVIPHLALGVIDALDVVQRLTIPTGPLYDGIAQIADKAGLGIKVYLESADPIAGYSLKFTVYRGLDYTTGSGRPLVRLTPDMDTISGLKEVRSIQQYKNVCYVYYQGIVTKHLAVPTDPEPLGWDRRVLVVNPTTAPVGHYAPGYQAAGGLIIPTSVLVVDAGDIAAFRAQVAADALANNNYINAIDGQTSPTGQYTYGQDYSLGDIIELEGLTGLITKARVTEYIRSQDKTGEKQYPTISVLTGPVVSGPGVG